MTIVAPANFTGPVTIKGGTIYAGDFSFTHIASVTITNNSTLDFGGSTPYNFPVTVSGTGVNGQGAIYNSFANNVAQVLNITLAGDTTFGGSQRWDLNPGSSISGPHKVTVSWSNSGGYGEWRTTPVGADVGDIEVATGTLGIKGMGNTFGNPNANLIIDPGCEVDFWTGTSGSDSGYARNIHVLANANFKDLTSPNTFMNANVTFEGSNLWQFAFGSGAQTMNGPITLNGLIQLQAQNAPVMFSNVVAGSGGFVSFNTDPGHESLVFSSSNTYSGPTVVGTNLTLAVTGNGSISHSSLIFFGGNNPANTFLDASGRPDTTLTLASSQTLGGIGNIIGSLVVSAGATLSPAGTNTTLGITSGANTTGTIAATSAVTLNANSTTVIKLNGSGVNDQIQAGTSIIYGGTLNLVNVSGAPYAVGNLFQVFNAASFTGSFTKITPATPGAGLAWSLTGGFLNVVSAPSQPVVNNVHASGGNFIFSGTGGTVNGTYSVLTTTNLATSLTNWTSVATNSYDSSGAFSVTNAISPNVPNQFYIIKQ